MKQTKEIPDHNTEEVATFLNRLLADEYVLYTKTRNTHWNIDGPNFFELHVFLENQYNALDVMIDDIAEQIHSLGHFAIGSMKDFLIAIKMSEDNHDFSNSEQIIQFLINDHETLIRIIRYEIKSVSGKFKDTDIADFMTSLMKQHERMARKLKILLSRPNFNSSIPIPTINQQPISLYA